MFLIGLGITLCIGRWTKKQSISNRCHGWMIIWRQRRSLKMWTLPFLWTERYTLSLYRSKYTRARTCLTYFRYYPCMCNRVFESQHYLSLSLLICCRCDQQHIRLGYMGGYWDKCRVGDCVSHRAFALRAMDILLRIGAVIQTKCATAIIPWWLQTLLS